jgi:hypothetical protein
MFEIHSWISFTVVKNEYWFVKYQIIVWWNVTEMSGLKKEKETNSFKNNILDWVVCVYCILIF